MISRYMHDPHKGQWEAVRWIPRYIKGTLDVGLIFEKDECGKHEYTGYVNSDYVGKLDKRQSTAGYVFNLSQVLVGWR